MSLLETSPINEKTRDTVAGFLGVGIAAPPAVPQEKILELIFELCQPNSSQQAWLTRLFRGSNIQTRGTVLAKPECASGTPTPQQSVDAIQAFYPASTGPTDGGPTTLSRMARYAAEAPALAIAAAERALTESRLGQSPVAAADISHLFTASCTGFMAPGLDSALIESLGLSPEIRRVHVGFMGCHAAFNTLAAARDVVRADSAAKVLVCCVELCTLHFAYGWDPGKLVANALFADGAAAAVVGQSELDDSAAWRLADTASLLMPNCADAMTWRIGNHGFEMTLSPGIPSLIRAHLRPWIESWLARHDLKITDVAGWAIHPGGPKVLDAVADALTLPPEALVHSREILLHHGNMSSATVLFILRRMMQESLGGPCVAIGLGPGLIAEAMLFNA
jgi:predicted naringenin-chalcone synthase